MSLAATESLLHRDLYTPSEVAISNEVAPIDGHGLPVPESTPTASFVAFILAGPGSMTLVTLLVLGITQVSRGASMSLWSLGVSTAFALWLPALLIALWASSARGEWGR